MIGADIVPIIQAEIARSRYNIHPHRIGVVSSYDPTTHSVKLIRQPEGIETGFIPLHAHHIGNGWGVMVGAQVGDQHVIGHVFGDVDVPFVAGRLFSNQDQPPQVQSGEILLQHEKGNKVFLDQNGNLQIVGSAGAKQVVTLGQDGSVTISDVDGGTVFLQNGNVYLGSKTASNAVQTTAGPSTKVFAVV